MTTEEQIGEALDAEYTGVDEEVRARVIKEMAALSEREILNLAVFIYLLRVQQAAGKQCEMLKNGKVVFVPRQKRGGRRRRK